MTKMPFNIEKTGPKIPAEVKSQIQELEEMAAIPSPIFQINEERSYEEICKTLGFYPAELIYSRLLRFFQKNEIKLYDYGMVKSWLTSKRKKHELSNWCWRSLRKKDVIDDYQWGLEHNSYTGSKYWEDGFYDSKRKEWECRPYESVVPIQILINVVNIEKEFTNLVKFFVSDYALPDPNKVDPFIMVRPAMRDPGKVPSDEYNLIFGHWDEPGFGF